MTLDCVIQSSTKVARQDSQFTAQKTLSNYLISNIKSLDGGVDDELVIGGYDTYVVDGSQH